MSLKPSVVARTTEAACPVSSALVAAVVPWKIISTESGRTPASARATSARSNARPGSAGVDGTFATRTLPSELVAIASVNVPPISMPTTQPGSATSAIRGKLPDERRYLAGEDVQGSTLHLPGQPREVQTRDERQVASCCPPVIIDHGRHALGRAEDDGRTQRFFVRDRHWRRQPRVAGSAPSAFHVLVLPADVPAVILDQLPAVQAFGPVPCEHGQVDADREVPGSSRHLELLPGERDLVGQHRGADVGGHEPVRDPAGPPAGSLAHRADPQLQPPVPSGQRSA